MYNWSDQLNFQMDLKRSKQGYALIMKCSHMSKPHVFGVISTDSFIERGACACPRRSSSPKRNSAYKSELKWILCFLQSRWGLKPQPFFYLYTIEIYFNYFLSRRCNRKSEEISQIRENLSSSCPGNRCLSKNPLSS